MKNLLIALALCIAWTASAQTTEPTTPAAEGYQFIDQKILPSTPTKDQSRSGTCWCYSALSMLEGEILRQGGEAPHLSEMWIVRHAFMDKAVKYIRMHGAISFTEGGATHDVIEGIKQHGIVPFESYPGLEYGTKKPDFHELSLVLKAYLDAVIQANAQSQKPLSTAWQRGFNALLDSYFGVLPTTFTYQGKQYTPQTFREALPLKMEDYVYITSFTHHPFYTQFVLEVPDNWMWQSVYNLPLDEMMAVIDHALAHNFPITWATDVSEKGFSRTKAIGIIPETNPEGLEGSEAEKWGKLTEAERENFLYQFNKPGKERVITQELRQEAFDNYETSDDHGMVLVGTAKDQQGNDYFKVLNSWDVRPPYDGFWYFSRPFVAYKTTSITVNKNALPTKIRKQLGIQ